MNAYYNEIIRKVLVDRRDVRWPEKKLSTVCFEIEELMRVVQRLFPLHCRFGLYLVKFRTLDHVITDLGRFEGVSFLAAEPFAISSMHVKQSCRMTS